MEKAKVIFAFAKFLHSVIAEVSFPVFAESSSSVIARSASDEASVIARHTVCAEAISSPTPSRHCKPFLPRLCEER